MSNPSTSQDQPLTNYISYSSVNDNGASRIGHLDAYSNKITPLSYASGTPLSNLYEVIEIGPENIIPRGTYLPLDSVKVLPPLPERDVLAIGKNYAEHAKEFNASGYDASDKVDMPSHPVIFTKRATSIIADGEDILHLPEFTSTLDYEGEIGVIIGKAGHKISEAEAPAYVWGYTIINDVTAREKQRDHKQFFIGKSGDTYCPMGPIAVPAKDLPKVLKIQTKVNGELRQQGTTDDLIFSVNTLVQTISEAQTIQPGDVIATGTPAGVGFGLNPPKFLQPGDVVEISVSGLGTLRNKVIEASAENYVQKRVSNKSVIPTNNLRIADLTKLGSKLSWIKIDGLKNGPPIIFIHGIDGNSTHFQPLMALSDLVSTHRCITYDLEGLGLSPTKVDSVVTIQSYVDDLHALFQHFKIERGATIIAHSTGTLTASTFSSQHPSLVSKLVLISPFPCPLPIETAMNYRTRAEAARTNGTVDVAARMALASVSPQPGMINSLVYAMILQGLLSQNPEGYAKGCDAMARFYGESIDFGRIEAETLVVAGDFDNISRAVVCKDLVSQIKNARFEALEGAGHGIMLEKVDALAKVVQGFL